MNTNDKMTVLLFGKYYELEFEVPKKITFYEGHLRGTIDVCWGLNGYMEKDNFMSFWIEVEGMYEDLSYDLPDFERAIVAHFENQLDIASSYGSESEIWLAQLVHDLCISNSWGDMFSPFNWEERLQQSLRTRTWDQLRKLQDLETNWDIEGSVSLSQAIDLELGQRFASGVDEWTEDPYSEWDHLTEI